MKYSSTWRGHHSLIGIEITETAGIFTGTAQLFSQGHKIGLWAGGNYGIDYSWDTLQRAINNLCVFMTWELDNQEKKGTIERDQDLLENLCHGRARAVQGEQERAAAWEKECQEENLLVDLEEGLELIAESIAELSTPVIPGHEVGEQLGLFG